MQKIWEAFRDDAAEAEKRFGTRPRYYVIVDRVEKSGRGFTVITDLDGQGDIIGPPQAHLSFDERQGKKLTGTNGERITVRGRVTRTTRNRLFVYDCEVE